LRAIQMAGPTLLGQIPPQAGFAARVGPSVVPGENRPRNFTWHQNRIGGAFAQDWNGSPSADPATGLGGIALPSGLTSGSVFAGLSLSSVSDAGTINFGGSAFSQTPPSGFSA